MEISEQKIKAYWNRPGGPFKTFAFLAGLGIAAYYLLPILTKIVWDTIHFGIACGIAALLLFLVTNKRVRLLAYSFWDVLMNNTFGLLFTWDPFVMWREEIRDMMSLREKARKQALDAETTKNIVQDKIESRKRELIDLINKGKVLQKQTDGDKGDLSLIADQIEEYRNYINQLTPMLNDLIKVGVFADKYDKNADRMIKKAKTQLELRKDAFETASVGNRVVSSILSFFQADPEKVALREQAADSYRRQLAFNKASMKKGLTITAEYMKSIDLDRAASEAKGLEMLDQIDQNIILDTTVPDSLLPKEVVIESKSVPGTMSTKYYDDLLK